jgi:hypothetical protein
MPVLPLLNGDVIIIAEARFSFLSLHEKAIFKIVRTM